MLRDLLPCRFDSDRRHKMFKLTFCGGAKEVTGANYLIENNSLKLLVDCGLVQGNLFAEEKNFAPFTYNPADVNYVFLTHAHLDHIGRLPRLVARGFKGKIFCTYPTKDLMRLMLLDNLHIHQEQQKYHRQPILYSEADIEKTLSLCEAVEYKEKLDLDKKLTAQFLEAGHILGSASISILFQNTKILFSGDLGNYPTPVPFLNPPSKVEDAHYIIIESTYGDQIHEDVERRKEILEDIIESTVKNNGALLIPAFALERTQELISELNELLENRRIPSIPVFIDSPLAIEIIKIYEKNINYLHPLAQEKFCSDNNFFRFKGIKMTRSPEESKKINSVPNPKVIIAGSGMSNGGRILFHEARYLPDPKSFLLIVGYQAAGSLGRMILQGARVVSIHNQSIPIRAQVKAIGGYSGHADQAQLLKWIEPSKYTCKRVFVVQGEPKPAQVLAQKIKDELGIFAEAPSPLTSLLI